METDFHTKSRLSLAGWGSLWYENRANPSSSGCCHVFILPTRCPFINLWLALALCLKRLVLNWLILDCCCCSSEETRSVSHRSFKVLNSTTVTLCNPRLPAGPRCTPLHPLRQGNKPLNSNNKLRVRKSQRDVQLSWLWLTPWCEVFSWLTMTKTITIGFSTFFPHIVNIFAITFSSCQ